MYSVLCDPHLWRYYHLYTYTRFADLVINHDTYRIDSRPAWPLKEKQTLAHIVYLGIQQKDGGMGKQKIREDICYYTW